MPTNNLLVSGSIAFFPVWGASQIGYLRRVTALAMTYADNFLTNISYHEVSPAPRR